MSMLIRSMSTSQQL